MILALDLGRRVGWCAGERVGGSHLFDQRDYGELSAAFSRWLADKIVEHRPRVLAIETPPAGLKGHAALILNGMFWDAQRVAVMHEISRRSIDPLSLKRWACGHHTATKLEMCSAAVTFGYALPSDDNHGDASVLHKWASVATAEEAAA